MRLISLLFLIAALFSVSACAQEPIASERERGEGPYERLILRGGTVIDGEGGPPIGPVDIVIEGDRIADVVVVGYPGVPIHDRGRPEAGPNDREIDVTGQYILPGFIDMHAHLGGSAQGIPAEYVLKLWLAHGITTVREPGSFRGLDWTLEHARLAEQGAIASPRIIPYAGMGMGWDKPIYSPEEAREWVQFAAERGAQGVKLFGTTPRIIEAILDETQRLNIGSMMHHSQTDVVRTNVLDSARMGLGSMEHWYGLPEAMFTDRVIQNYPADYNYQNEQDRFGEAGKLWAQAAEPGSERWNEVRDELIDLDFTINPTMTIYEASRNLMAQRNADWHEEYTLPRLWDFFTPSRYAHGSYWFDWTTENEVAWRENFHLWMQFLNDYKNNGGRVTVGSDAGYIYKIYGFGYIQELELLREAGFHPLEVIQSATLNGAEALGMEDQIGSIVAGKVADLVIVNENPLANFKVLFGTGHYRLNENNEPYRTEGIRYTIANGIVYDVSELLADVRSMVDAEQAERASAED